MTGVQMRVLNTPPLLNLNNERRPDRLMLPEIDASNLSDSSRTLMMLPENKRVISSSGSLSVSVNIEVSGRSYGLKPVWCTELQLNFDIQDSLFRQRNHILERRSFRPFVAAKNVILSAMVHCWPTMKILRQSCTLLFNKLKYSRFATRCINPAMSAILNKLFAWKSVRSFEEEIVMKDDFRFSEILETIS